MSLIDPRRGAVAQRGFRGVIVSFAALGVVVLPESRVRLRGRPNRPGYQSIKALRTHCAPAAGAGRGACPHRPLDLCSGLRRMRRGRVMSHRGLRLAPAAHAVPLAGAGRHRADLAGGDGFALRSPEPPLLRRRSTPDQTSAGSSSCAIRSTAAPRSGAARRAAPAIRATSRAAAPSERSGVAAS